MNDRDDDEQEEQRPGALTTAPRGNMTARQDFGGQSLTQSNPATDALVATATAAIQARCIMAIRRPRNLDDTRVEIMRECRRPEFADVATYSRPVGKEKNDAGQWVEKFAEGLSIRFAEVALRCMRNMAAEVQTIYDDATQRLVMVTVTDYEGNNVWSTTLTIAKTTERKQLRKGQRPLSERENSYGDRVFIVEANDQQVNVKAAAEISKAVRTLILRAVPGHIQDEAFKICKDIAATRDAKDPAAARRRMFDAFAERGIRPSDLEAWLGHPAEQMTKAEGEQLKAIHSAITEGELSWAEAMTDRTDKPAAKPAPPATPTPPTNGQAPSGPPPGVPQTPPPAAAPQQEPAKPTSSGKGAGALKGALRSVKAAAPTPDLRQAEPAWMAPEPEQAKPYLDIPPGLDSPAEGNEYRGCAKCGAVVEVPTTDPPGGMCYACSAAARE
ncbi:MAG TPA: hypothetical protein VLN57_21320 [Xanthobacteraceae bacterium]|nr:hypothetical protein [Xanthobacteraceae bacterium]